MTPEGRAGLGRAQVERDSDSPLRIRGLRGGHGEVAVKRYGFGGAAAPMKLLTFDFPPGASEGLHTHRHGDPNEPAYEEFYYIVAGRGRMTLGDEQFEVAAGDHVYAPLDTPHGIENIDPAEHLKVFLSYIAR